VPLLPVLLEKSKQVLVLSGILREQTDLIVSELRNYGIENPKSIIRENGFRFL
jgi:hypothetical protein